MSTLPSWESLVLRLECGMVVEQYERVDNEQGAEACMRG